jgi:dolichol kinase
MITVVEKKNTAIAINRIYKELFRKAVHSLIAFVPLLAAINLSITFIALLGGICVYIISELIRINGQKNFLIARITRLAARQPNSKKIITGPITLACGALFSLLLFPPEAARIAILALAFGDGIASIAGQQFASIEIPYTRGKTLAGSFACFIVIYLLAFRATLSMPAAFIIASGGTLVEALPIKEFDNIALPLTVGGLAYLLI